MLKDVGIWPVNVNINSAGIVKQNGRHVNVLDGMKDNLLMNNKIEFNKLEKLIQTLIRKTKKELGKGWEEINVITIILIKFGMDIMVLTKTSRIVTMKWNITATNVMNAT